jgi:hypothetical protein
VLPALVPLMERVLTDPSYANATCRRWRRPAARHPRPTLGLPPPGAAIDDGHRRLGELQAIVGTGVDPEIMGAWLREATAQVRAAEAELATLGEADRPVDADAVRQLVAKVAPHAGGAADQAAEQQAPRLPVGLRGPH